ncbi:MAG: ABC transporter ATP-binding protein [Streptosporangiaceae bacterium]
MSGGVDAARCVEVTKTYVTGTGDVAALVGVAAGFPAATVTALVGPSGSGKSTLLRLLACLDRPDAGRVEVAGEDIARLGAWARRAIRRHTIGYVFQEPSANLLDYLTAVEHLRMAAQLRGRRDSEEPGRLLDLLGLTHRANHVPHALSGGEQQRLAVGFAVAGGPAVLVADEPTAQLDHVSGERVLEAIRHVADRGYAVVVASHDRAVTEVADRVVRLAGGRAEDVG